MQQKEDGFIFPSVFLKIVCSPFYSVHTQVDDGHKLITVALEDCGLLENKKKIIESRDVLRGTAFDTRSHHCLQFNLNISCNINFIFLVQIIALLLSIE